MICRLNVEKPILDKFIILYIIILYYLTLLIMRQTLFLSKIKSG